MILNKKIFKNVVPRWLAEVFSKILWLIFVILLARNLGVEGFGMFSFALSFAGMFIILVELGTHQIISREISRDFSKAKVYLGNGIGIKILLSFLCLLIFSLVVRGIHYPFPLVLYLAFLGMISFSFIDIFNWVYRSYQKMWIESLIVLLVSLLILIGGLGGIKSGYGVAYFVGVVAISRLIGAFSSGVIFRKKFLHFSPNFEFGLWKGLFIASFPIGIRNLFSILYTRLDVTLLYFMKGNHAVGLFSAIRRIMEGVEFIPAIFMFASFPLLSQYFGGEHSKFKKLFNESFFLLSIIGALIAFLTYFFSPTLISFLIGKDFQKAVPGLRLVSFIFPIFFLNYLFTYSLIAANRQKFLLPVMGIGTGTNLLFNLLLIPKFSFIGTCISIIIAETTIFLLLGIFLWKK